MATTLLLHFDGGFADEVGAATVTPTYGPSISSTTSKFGSGSLQTDGGYGHVRVTDLPAIGSGDFTVECWFNVTSGNGGLFDFRGGGGPLVFLDDASLGVYNPGGIYTSGPRSSNGVFHHFALVRAGGVMTGYLDGVAHFSGTDTGALGTVLTIASGDGGNGTITGFTDEFRVSDTAVYTANFTPPTEPFSLGGGGGGAISATASQPISIDQVTTAALLISGAAAQIISVGSAAAGAVVVKAQSAAAISVSQVATATGLVQASAAQTIPVGQSAAGNIGAPASITATAASTVSAGQQAQAAVLVAGVSTQSISVASVASASAPIRASADQGIAVEQHATGSAASVSAQVEQSIPIGQSVALAVIVRAVAASKITIAQEARAQQTVVPTPVSRTLQLSSQTRLVAAPFQPRIIRPASQTRLVTARG